jgi:hypothetical protein
MCISKKWEVVSVTIGLDEIICSGQFIFINIYSRYQTYSQPNMVTTRRKTMRCAACFRGVIANGKKYCVYHSQAYDSLEKQYKAWVNAYGGLSWEGYLKRLLTLDQSGSWVKDVINIEQRNQKKG